MKHAEIDGSVISKRNHERFKATVVLNCGDGKPRTMNQWLQWQATRDPLNEKRIARKTVKR
jgi:hypothetical protein